MRRFGVLHVACLVLSLAPLTGCAANEADSEETSSDEAEVKKKVKPKGGNGAFELGNAAWNPNGVRGEALGTHFLGSDPIAIGGRIDRVAGAYEFSLGAMDYDSIRFPKRVIDVVELEKGKFTRRAPTGLLVRYDRPINLGNTAVLRVGGTGQFGARGEWATRSSGALVYMAPGEAEVVSNIDSAVSTLALPEGQLAQIVLPTSKVTVSLDSYDRSYPTPQNCPGAYIAVGVGNDTDSRYLRDDFGTPRGPFIVPHGDRSKIIVSSYGLAQTAPTGGNVSFVLNRLEVDDVEVTSPGGQTVMVPGSYEVEVLEGATFRRIGCFGMPTHTGLDLPDGTYRITATAQGASGRVTHVEEISFP